ncbi:MAG: hypothetical protein RLZZ623_1177 [Actinomycetota bacterium]
MDGFAPAGDVVGGDESSVGRGVGEPDDLDESGRGEHAFVVADGETIEARFREQAETLGHRPQRGHHRWKCGIIHDHVASGCQKTRGPTGCT